MLALRVTKITPLTDRITEFHFENATGGALPTWSAGAHVDFETPQGVRSYSLLRWPDETPEFYRIAVQREETGDGGSVAMHALSEGQEIAAEVPKNDFELLNQGRPIALLAGGIGITPLISMAAALTEQGRDFVLHYAGRREDQMAYLTELSGTLGSKLTTYFDDRNPIGLAELVPSLKEHSIYICGPQGMIETARDLAETAGISSEHIHVELFTSAASTSADAAFQVELASSGQIVEVREDQTIIEALELAGVDVMYDCQRGDCGICQTDVIDGVPDHRDVVLSQSERSGGKVMQICVSRALSPRLVLDL